MTRKPEDLLAHTDFMRGLALNLLADEHRAEDISQQTWLASLERSPPAGIPLRAWLSRVAWNLAIKLMRGENRRFKREKASALPDRVPSTEEVVAREEIRRTVVEAVLELGEPYRSVILLRFYEDLPPRDIARTLGIPVETVRTRLKRGLARLRDRLDLDYQGDRKKWCLAIAPLAGLKLAAPSAHAAAGAAAGFFGTLVTATKLKIGLAALVVLTTTLVLWRIVPNAPNRESAGSFTMEKAEPEKESIPDKTDTASSRLHRSIPFRRVRMKPELPVLSGRVINEVTGLPVTNYQVYLAHAGWGPYVIGREGTCTMYVEAPALPITNFQLHLVRGEKGPFGLFPEGTAENPGHDSPVRRTVMNEEGRYTFTLVQGGLHTLYVEAPGFFPPVPIEVQIPHKEGLTDFTIALEPWRSISGRVVDDATGQPVRDAFVAAQMITGDGMRFRSFDACTGTDHEGRFTLTRLRGTLPDDTNFWVYRIAACHPDFAEVFEEAVSDGREIELRLEKGSRISGMLRDHQGRPRPGADIILWGESTPIERTVVTDQEGRFTTPPALPGALEVRAVFSRGRSGITGESRIIELADRDMELHFGIEHETVTWQGTLHDGTGRPAGGGTIRVIAQDPLGREGPLVRGTRLYSVECDRNGRFEIHGILPGCYDIRLRFPDEDWGITGYQWGPILFDAPGEVHRDIRLPETEISGMLIDGETGEPARRGTYWIIACLYSPQGAFLGKQYFKKTIEDGRFLFNGLPPGAYSFGAGAVFDASGLGYAPSGAQVDRLVFLAEHQAIRNLNMMLPVRGTLKIALSGLDKIEGKEPRITIQNVGGTPAGALSLRRKPDAALWACAAHWETGSWILVLEGETVGRIERPFRIFRNRTTELKIDASEFPGYKPR